MIGPVPVMILGQLARALGMATIEVQEPTRAPRDREALVWSSSSLEVDR